MACVADSITTPRLAKFFLDTVAQVHLTARKQCFLTLTELQEPMKYTDATGSIVVAIAKGDAMIPVFFDNTVTWLKLTDVYYAPDLNEEQSLVSVSGLYAAGISIESKIDIDHCSLLDSSLNVVARGSSRDHRWFLDVDWDLIRYNDPEIQNPFSAESTPEIPDMVYHESISIQSLDSICTFEDPHPPNEELMVIDDDPFFPGCSEPDDCSENYTHAGPLSVVYSDFYGPLPVSVGGNRYVASFIDEYSRFARIYFLKSPTSYLTAVKSFINRAEKDSGSGKLQTLYTGQDEGEHISTYLSAKGITLKMTSLQTSVARQFNCTLFTRVQFMLFEAEIEHGWWEDAAAMVVYMFNRSPNPFLDFRLPLDVWSQSTKPTSFVYRAFGSRCTATLVEIRGEKEVRKSLECRVLRFDVGTEEWVVLTVVGDRIFGTKEVVFEQEYEIESE